MELTVELGPKVGEPGVVAQGQLADPVVTLLLELDEFRSHVARLAHGHNVESPAGVIDRKDLQHAVELLGVGINLFPDRVVVLGVRDKGRARDLLVVHLLLLEFQPQLNHPVDL